MLLYSLLHLTGYDLSLDDIKQFRQWGSKTPGHPGTRPHAGRRNHHRAARAGLRQCGRHGDGRSAAGRALQPPGPRGHRSPHLRDRQRRRPDGRRRVGSGVARRAPAARQADLPVRRQLRHPVGGHRHHFHRGSRRAVRRIRLACRCMSPTATTLDAIERRLQAARDADRQAFADPRPHPHRLRLARAGQLTRRTARRWAKRMSRTTKRTLGWPEQPPFLVPPEALAHFREALERRQAERRRMGRSFRRVRQGVSGARRRIRAQPAWRRCRMAGMRTCRCSRRTPRAWPRAKPAAR